MQFFRNFLSDSVRFDRCKSIYFGNIFAGNVDSISDNSVAINNIMIKIQMVEYCLTRILFEYFMVVCIEVMFN